MLGRVGIGADEREHGVGGVRRRSPDLLTVDDEVITVPNSASRQRGEVRSGAGLAIALRPGDVAVEDRREVLLLLLVRAVDDQRRTKHVDTGAANGRRAGLRNLLIEDELLHRGETATAVFRRPVRRDPMMLGECGMPVDGGPVLNRVAGLAVVLPGPLGHRASSSQLAVSRRQPVCDQG